MDTKAADTRDTAQARQVAEIKFCCAAAYQSDWARLLLGDSFHPGGKALTRRLGETLGVGPGVRVLDVACGKGTSAIYLARAFGCEVLGVDYGEQNARAATETADVAGVGALARFVVGDAERLPIADGSYDAVVCECAFCTFPNKPAAAAELARVLRPGGRVGLSDLTRQVEEIPTDLRGLLAWFTCIADAQPVEEYVRYLTAAGLRMGLVEPHDEALGELVHDIRTKLLGAELLVKLKQAALPGVDFDQAHALARAASDAVRAQQFGYALLMAEKPAG